MKKNDLKRYIKSFGRIKTAPPLKIIKSKKGKGSYDRKKLKKELKKLLRSEAEF